jgi:dipeptidyl aminopeptidase/acylaminoacyl peptidase
MKQYMIEQFINTETILNNSTSSSGENILFSSDRTGIFNVYTIPTNGGDVTALTHSENDACLAVSYFPHDDRFLYLSDKGGDEIFHIYGQDKEGNIRDITPGEKERAIFYKWSSDGNSFIYGSNKRDPRFMDVYEMDADTFEGKCIFQNEGGYEFATISDDQRYLALSKVINLNSTQMYIFDRNIAKIEPLTSHNEDIQYAPQAFSKDNQSLYYLTDKDYEFMYVKRYDIETGDSIEVYRTNCPVDSVKFTRYYTYMVLSINNDAFTEAKIINTKTDEVLELPSLPHSQVTSIHFSKDEKFFCFLLNGSTSPSNVYVYNLEEKKLLQLSDTLNKEIEPEDLVKVEVVRYPSFDGVSIPAIFYKPKLAKANGKIPALVWVHGGPGGQSRVDYNPLLQYLANHGYAVLAINNRGSSGYGKTFFKMADLRHGEVDLSDCVEAKSFLQSTGYVDEDRIGIIGGSYGGYMTLAALAFRPDEFQVGVDIFGVSNWVRTLKSIPSWWEIMRDSLYQKIGNPFTSEDYLRSISPLFHAKNITKPLIVLQGANDPRVLKVESDEIVDIAKENGVPVEYIVFDDEGHGFSKKKNRIIGYKAILEFLNGHLKK